MEIHKALKLVHIIGNDFFETEENISRSRKYWWPCLIFTSYGELQKSIEESQSELKALVLLESLHRHQSQYDDERVALLLGEYTSRSRQTCIVSMNGENVEDFYAHFHDLTRDLGQKITKDCIEVWQEEAINDAIKRLESSLNQKRSKTLPNPVPQRRNEELGSTESRGRQVSVAASSEVSKKKTPGRKKKNAQPSIITSQSSKSTSVKQKNDEREKGKDKMGGSVAFTVASGATSVASTIYPDDKWSRVWDVLWNLGWRWFPGNNLIERIYYAPGGKSYTDPNAVENVDYFLSEDDVKDYARKIFKWDPDGGNKRKRSRSRDALSSKKARSTTSRTPKRTPVPKSHRKLSMDSPTGSAVSEITHSIALETEDETNLVFDDATPSVNTDDMSVAASMASTTTPETIIDSSAAVSILCKLGFKCYNNLYFLPGADTTDPEEGTSFISGTLLREHVCREGITLKKPVEDMLKETDLWNLTRWLKMTFVPLKIPTEVPSLPALSDTEAWVMLRNIGYRYSGSYATPNGVRVDTLQCLQQHVCRNGISRTDDDGMSAEDHLRLSLWATDFEVEFFTSDTRRRRRSTEKMEDYTKSKNNRTTARNPKISSAQAVENLDDKFATVAENAVKSKMKKSRQHVPVRTPPGYDQSPLTREYARPKPIPLTPVTEAALEKMKNIKGTPVQNDDAWINVLEKMKFTGWHYAKGNGLQSWVWLPPEGNAKGKEGVDYFPSELDLKRFAHLHFGWAGDDAFWREVKQDADVDSGRGRRGRRMATAGNNRTSLNVKKKVVAPAVRRAPQSQEALLEAIEEEAENDVCDDDGDDNDSKINNDHDTQQIGSLPETNEDQASQSTNSPTNKPNDNLPELPQSTNSPANEPNDNLPELQSLSAAPASKWLHSALEALHPSFDPTLPHNRPAVFGLPTETAVTWTNHIDEITGSLKQQIKHCCIVTDSDEPLDNNKVNDNQLAHAVLYLCGSPGTGKTTLAQMCCRDAVQWASHTTFKHDKNWNPIPTIVYINVNHLQGTASYMSEITRVISSELGLKDGSSLDCQLDLRNNYNNNNKRQSRRLVILVLDEIETLACTSNTDKKQTLQSIFNWASAPHYSLSLIGISNSVENHSSQILSTYSDPHPLRKLVFQPYTPSHLVTILKHRVGAIIAPNALEFAARKVAATSGDARRALELAQCAIRKAMEQNPSDDSTLISPDSTIPLVNLSHMMKAIRESGGVPHLDAIRNLPSAAKVTLQVAVTLSQCRPNEKELDIGMLKRWCNDASRHNLLDYLGEEHFRDVLMMLSDAGLLMTGKDNVGEGWTEHVDFTSGKVSLGVQLEDVECALDQTLNTGFYNTMRQYVKNLRN